MKKLKIVTERLIICEFTEDIAYSLHINSLDADTKRFVPDEVFETVEDAETAIKRLISYYKEENRPLIYAILLKDGTHIGHIQAVPLKDDWEIGYHIAERKRNQGYATEALNAFLPVIISKLRVNEIVGIAHQDNQPSSRILEKCGFTLEYQGLGLYQGRPQYIARYRYLLFEN